MSVLKSAQKNGRAGLLIPNPEPLIVRVPPSTQVPETPETTGCALAPVTASPLAIKNAHRNFTATYLVAISARERFSALSAMSARVQALHNNDATELTLGKMPYRMILVQDKHFGKRRL